jgi:5-methylcytosine-specific restriction endonuclease McrA
MFRRCRKQIAKWNIGKMNTKQKRKIKQKLINFYGLKCWWCQECLPKNKLTIDHLVPKSHKGSNSLENLRLACLPCNKDRGNSLYPPKAKPINFSQKYQFLAVLLVVSLLKNQIAK